MKEFLWGCGAGAAVAAAGIGAFQYLRGHRQINRHVEDYRNHWSRQDEHPSEGVLHYVALGDSAAQGVGASHVGASYVSILGARLKMATHRNVAITNLSVSGAVSGDVVANQLPTLRELDFEPDIVTLDIGGNDVVFTASNSVESFSDSFEVILQALPPGSFVGDVPWFTIPGLTRRSKAMAQRAVELIEQYGHHLVPLHEAARQLGYLRFHTNTAADWFHPNDKGYRAWADLFWEAMEASGRVDELREEPHERTPGR